MANAAMSVALCKYQKVQLVQYKICSFSKVYRFEFVAPCSAEPPLAEGAKPLSHKQIFALVLW